MSSISNNENLFYNAGLFSRRFPELSKSLGFDSENGIKNFEARIPETYFLEEAKLHHEDKKNFTARINGKYLHSKYNPVKEAEQNFSLDFFKDKKTKSSCIFYGLGLGYLQELYAKKNPKSSLIIVEPDLFIFLLFLKSRPLDEFFMHENLTILLGLYPKDVLDFFEAGSFSDVPIFKSPSLIEINSSWFFELETLKKRRDEKKNLNKNTFKKFGKLWLKNFLKNAAQIEKLPGILQIENFFKHYPCLILAAGPGLDDVCDLIKEYQDRFLVIASDTAVRACHRKGIKPDFILLMDAQYWNYLHLADLDISDSILVTESSVYPAVFRLKARAKFLCTSMFPLAQYIEKAIGEKGKLVTGGSVATACWDFARILGCSELIFCGLDLAFPNFQTHFKGSRFEEDVNSVSSRFQPSETASHKTLYYAAPGLKEGYLGKVLSDNRMQMYAWWFESKIAEFPESKTYNFLSRGLKIPNMEFLDKEGFLIKAEKSSLFKKQKADMLSALCSFKGQDSVEKKKISLAAALKELSSDLAKTKEAAKEGMDICRNILDSIKAEKTPQDAFIKQSIDRLNRIDEKIKTGKTNAVIGFDLLLAEDSNKNFNEKSFVSVYEESFLIYKKIYDIIGSLNITIE
ncbi:MULTISPECIES: motility associated factor glycosyltransferase family protein [unclassified Treponema]|uniref:motility associated factor glycosyltransferase family protein n=1 Tax=unclassified Treponema TaxID=2638727 RepID=UPI0020A61216|nr:MULTISPECIES: 6-hydroxymethylpterin diphosphokinase MptE-like protein [unclassified Treponema]UTC67776.1 motility associated factor glycosyltransferase family protein [Treponema sp. OMZ 789]UTC70501.1 motility associated factor glycosyltransferase family protein [Treponema sp. OMZ 790]UTC73213.1 motility associated factor glycosyltransferase family protein [Treponema sp. OMZ 791]